MYNTPIKTESNKKMVNDKKEPTNNKKSGTTSKIKRDVPDKKRREIALAIRVWILQKSSVSAFAKECDIDPNTVACWVGAQRLPSLGNALKLERLSNGELTKEFLCPQYYW